MLVITLRTGIAAPNILVRLVYLGAFFIPLLTKYRNLYLPCLVAFTAVSINHFAYGYLPYDMFSYAMISIVVLAATVLIHRNSVIKVNPFFLMLFLYVIIINVVFSGNPQEISYCILSISCGAMIINSDSNQRISNMLTCFSVVSLALSFIYLTNFETFLQSYNAADDIERAGWTDPNYLSCIVGMGVVTSLVQLFRNKHASLYSRLFWIVTIIISLMSQLLMASRGGILSVIVSTLILLIFADVKAKYKIIITLLLVGVLIWLYSNNYFELLEYRIANDSSGGSGRTGLWKMKLSAFSNESNILNLIFGFGHTGALQLAFGNQEFGFHNDYLAILCSYGVVGFFMMLYLMFRLPFKNTTKTSRPIVASFVVYLALVCMTLEPLASGRLTYFAFYYLILLSRSIS